MDMGIDGIITGYSNRVRQIMADPGDAAAKGIPAR